MRQNTNKVGVLQRPGKTLREFLEFIISPWLNRVNVKDLQEKVYRLERQLLSKGLPDKEKNVELMIEHLQAQIDSLRENVNTQLDNIKKSDLPTQVEEILKQTVDLSEIIKPTVEILIRQLEEKKQYPEENADAVEIQARQERLQVTLTQIEKLTASFPNLEAKRLACIEAGKWLLTYRSELAQEVASELLSPQDPQVEIFGSKIRQYLKLLGHCLENGIQPSLLYQGVITHQEPPSKIYLQAFQLILDQHISTWESSDRVSGEAALELRKYFSYLIDYLVKSTVNDYHE